MKTIFEIPCVPSISRNSNLERNKKWNSAFLLHLFKITLQFFLGSDTSIHNQKLQLSNFRFDFVVIRSRFIVLFYSLFSHLCHSHFLHQTHSSACIIFQHLNHFVVCHVYSVCQDRKFCSTIDHELQFEDFGRSIGGEWRSAFFKAKILWTLNRWTLNAVRIQWKQASSALDLKSNYRVHSTIVIFFFFSSFSLRCAKVSLQKAHPLCKQTFLFHFFSPFGSCSSKDYKLCLKHFICIVFLYNFMSRRSNSTDTTSNGTMEEMKLT